MRQRTSVDGTRQNGYRENDSMKVEIEEIELLLGLEDSEVDLRQIFR